MEIFRKLYKLLKYRRLSLKKWIQNEGIICTHALFDKLTIISTCDKSVTYTL